MEDSTVQSSRPTSLEEMETVLAKVFQKESRERGLAFQPLPGDVIISPYPKCGTTWLQHIAHGLRTRGSMDFDEISSVVPWIERAYDLGIDLTAPQAAAPRVFKSHLSYYDIPKGARYICAFRNPYSVARSYYRFFEGWFFEPGTISLEAFLDWRWPHDKMHESGYWYHLGSWWEQRRNPNVLLLCYEDMLKEMPGTVKKVADLMGIQLDGELLEIVIQQSSREFMLAHQGQFDERAMRRRSEAMGGLPSNSRTQKITAGSNAHPRYALTPAIKTMMDAHWWEQIEDRFGFADYEAFCEALRAVQ